MNSNPSKADRRARYLMIGGFLGAGKTTAVGRLARRLTDEGLRVGLITNDQSDGLVDTTLLRSQGFAVEEIAGGCFCCRFDSLESAAARLSATARPDVFLAEPVGSCTDLVATVSYPLRRIWGERFTIAPLSVLVDPRRALRVLGLSAGRSFSEKVVYVYRKQLEEADLIVVNKCDAVEAAEREDLVAALGSEFPRAEVLCCSARTGQGLEAWFERILTEESAYGATMELDYDVYAAGEALLGWLNATLRVQSPTLFDANRFLADLCEGLRRPLVERGLEIAHLKATFEAEGSGGMLAAVSLTSSEGDVDQREALVDGVRGGQLILNLRAEAEPELLHELVRTEMQRAEKRRAGLSLVLEHEEHFSPAPPRPTERVTSAQAVALAREGGS